MLVDCKACGGQISRSAASCPKCGHPNWRVTRLALVPALVVVIALVSLLAWQRSAGRAENESAAMSVVTELAKGYQSDLAQGDARAACTKASQIADLYSSIKNSGQSDIWRSRSAICTVQPRT
jgi:hypothetical protein